MVGLIGVFGGTFDPPHHGHLNLASSGRIALRLGKVLWVVTAQPPHKPDVPITPLETRLAMVAATIGEDPGFELSRADIDRPGPHYALDTMRWLKERDPEADYLYLMGADSLRDLPTWHEPQRFIEACSALGVMHRPDVDVDMDALEGLLPGIRAKVHFFRAPLIASSSRDVRRRVRDGEPFHHLVPHTVADIIDQNGLYR
jgi:nicotinate-nucleotide adenylyltransferase